ncbi:MAG: hypothetical protein HOM18_11170 [Candidatus Marinimicrobia bacterium]|nr:hypothetical protein [Candidatus Neomarinimicrobiota bacterium]
MAIRASISYASLQASVSSAKPAASITYELASATGIWTDPDSKNRFVRDELPLSDVRFNFVEKNLADTTVMQEVPAWHLTKPATPEILSVADVFTKVVAYNRSFTDAFTLDDLSQIDKDFYGNKGNIFAFTDIIGLTHEKSLVDDYTVGDIVENLVSKFLVDVYTFDDEHYAEVIKGLADDTVLADFRVTKLEKALVDSVNIPDEYTAAFSLPKAETLTLAENFAKVVSYSRSFTDAFTLDDLSQIDKDFYGNKGNIFAFTDIIGLTHSKKLTDSYTVGDVFVKAVDFYRNFADSLSFSEATDLDVQKSEADTVSMQSILETSFTAVKEDSYTVGDAAVNSLTKVLVDAFALDDSTLVNKDFFGAKGNVLGFSDVFAKSVEFVRSFDDAVSLPDVPAVTYATPKEDTFGFTETVLIGWFYERIVNDLLRVSDKVPSVLGAGALNTLHLNSTEDNVRTFIDPGAADNLGFSDIQTSSINKTLNDIFSLDDAALVNKDYFGHKGNALGFSDVIAKTLVFVRAFTDTLSVADASTIEAQKIIADITLLSDTNVFSTGKGVSEILSISETIGMQLGKTLTDTFALDDAALIDKDYFGTKGNIFSFSDEFSRSVDYSRSFTEALSTSDTSSMVTGKGLSHNLPITDELVSVIMYNRNFTDTTSVTSVKALSLGKNFTNSITSISDLSVVAQTKNISDLVSFSESTDFQIVKAISDGIGLDDSTLVNKNYFGNKGNIMSISDVVVVDLVVSNTINSSALNVRTLN